MPDKSVGFLAVIARLRMAIDVASDALLAERLGMSSTAFNNRKKRESLPTRHIDALINAEELNPEFIYDGIGSVHIDIDGESWASGMHKRVSQVLKLDSQSGVLMSQGYSRATLKSIAAGKTEPTAKFLRDMRRYLALDLNWLVCGDADTALSRDEQGLVAAYRKAPGVGKEFIRHAAGMAREIASSAPVAREPEFEIDLVKDYKPNTVKRSKK